MAGNIIKFYAEFEDDGRPKAFYNDHINGLDIPDTAVEIFQEHWSEFMDYPGMRRWDGEKVVEYTPPLPMPTADDYRREIQNLIDTKAQEKDYDSGSTLASYVNSTIQQWATEASAFVAWRDVVWLHALTELDKVQSGARSQPSIEDFLAELPDLQWPES